MKKHEKILKRYFMYLYAFDLCAYSGDGHDDWYYR